MLQYDGICILGVHVPYICIHLVCLFMWGLQCSNITQWQNYYVGDLVLGKQEITGQEKKIKERTILSVLTVNDRKEENKVPSSYLDSLAKTPSKMVTNYKHKKILQLFLITEKGCKSQHQLQRSQWSSQHCRRNRQPVPDPSGPGSRRKEYRFSGATWSSARWVRITLRCHRWCWARCVQCVWEPPQPLRAGKPVVLAPSTQCQARSELGILAEESNWHMLVYYV